ncbi:MAG: TetR/AcrR family transcriptional regulator [Gammaproteobacteria bacterium]|nr:TetR/AcrR family transcriptional regulator [Gammaproteobacteria bacterium]MDH5692619.1 TetR/AcrR family transcriptional regulator [Gammaproteobacteria bacterium]
MPPKVSDEHSEQRCSQIINAAMNCFSRKGIHQTSMKEICAEAELSPGAVYSYFDSKEAIIDAVYRACNQHDVEIFNSAREQNVSLEEQIEFNVRSFLNGLMQEHASEWVRADLMFRSEALTNPQFMSYLQQNYFAVINMIEELVQYWQAKGRIKKDLDSKSAAQVLFGMVNNAAFQFTVDADFDVEKYANTALKIIFGEFLINNN